MKYKSLFLLLFLSLVFSVVNAMGFFDGMKVTLFSATKGVVTMGGQPVAGATITRTAIPNNDKTYSDSTTSNSKGRFKFEPMQISMFLKLLPTSIVVSQKVTISHEGNEYLAWQTDNFNGVEHGELNEHDAIASEPIEIDLTCELNNKETDKAGAYTMVISGICSWPGQRELD